MGVVGILRRSTIIRAPAFNNNNNKKKNIIAKKSVG